MIDSKKLAATPLTEFELGTNEFCLAAMCHYDAGASLGDIAFLMKVEKHRIAYAVNKGRQIRDRWIAEEAAARLKAIQEGTTPVPWVNREIPDVRVVAVSFMCPPRGVVALRRDGPIKPTHVAPLTVQ